MKAPASDMRIRNSYIVSRASNPEGVVDLRTPVALEAKLRAESLATLRERVGVVQIRYVKMGAIINTYIVPPPLELWEIDYDF